MAAGNTYVSIQSDIHIEIIKIDDGTAESLESVFQKNSTTIGLYSQIEYHRELLTPALSRIEQKDPDVAQWLSFIQGSLESIAAAVSGVLSETSNAQQKRVSLSAVGMQVPSDVSIQTGDYAQLILELLPSRTRMMVIGQVTNIDTSDGGSEPLLSFEFDYIREPDQEVLIRHIHQAQIAELQQVRKQREKSSSGKS